MVKSESETINITRGDTSSTYPPNYIPMSVSFTSRYSSGSDTPNFHARKRAGELIPHTAWLQTTNEHEPLTASLKGIRNSDGAWWEATNYYPLTGSSNYFLLGIGSSPDTSYAMSEVQRAASSIYNEGYDVLTGFIEARKIVPMFKRTLKTITSLSKNAKRLTRDDIMSAWAEGRYGYRTLAFDLRDLNDALNNYQSDRTIWTERSGYSQQTSKSYASTITWSSRWIDVTYTDLTSHSIRGSVAALIKPARFSFDVARTGWELVPYSFVLDWVISVGDALGAHSLVASAEATTASIGTFSETKRILSTTSRARPGWTISGGNFSYTGRATQTTRTPTSISLKPTLRGRLIRPEQILDLTSFVRAQRRRF